MFIATTKGSLIFIMKVEELSSQINALAIPKHTRKMVDLQLEFLRDCPDNSLDTIATFDFLTQIAQLPWKPSARSGVSPKNLPDLPTVNIGQYVPAYMHRRLMDFIATYPAHDSKNLDQIPVLVGPPGTGKRTLTERIAHVLNMPVREIDLGFMAHDGYLFGTPSDRSLAESGALIRAIMDSGRPDTVIVLRNLGLAVEQWPDRGLDLLQLLTNYKSRQRFRDRFLNIEFDLTDILFVVHLNSTDELPEIIGDQTFLIDCPGYTSDMRKHLAITSVMPKILDTYGLEPTDVTLGEDAAGDLIKEYANEPGLYSLQNVLHELVRQLAAKKERDEDWQGSIDSAILRDLLGAPCNEHLSIKAAPKPGVSKGIVLSKLGASVEPLETVVIPGEKYFSLIDSQNTALYRATDTAYHFVRSRMTELDISARQLYEYGYQIGHQIHPTNQDSAVMGLPMLVSIVSILRDRPVDPELALVGELTLNGQLLGVTHLNHRLLAAERAGIRRVILPKATSNAVAELPPDLHSRISLVMVNDVEQAIRVALQ